MNKINKKINLLRIKIGKIYKQTVFTTNDVYHFTHNKPIEQTIYNTVNVLQIAKIFFI